MTHGVARSTAPAGNWRPPPRSTTIATPFVADSAHDDPAHRCRGGVGPGGPPPRPTAARPCPAPDIRATGAGVRDHRRDDAAGAGEARGIARRADRHRRRQHGPVRLVLRPSDQGRLQGEVPHAPRGRGAHPRGGNVPGNLRDGVRDDLVDNSDGVHGGARSLQRILLLADGARHGRLRRHHTRHYGRAIGDDGADGRRHRLHRDPHPHHGGAAKKTLEARQARAQAGTPGDT